MIVIEHTPPNDRSATPEALWESHYVPLRHFCAGVVGPSDAEDLATDTFLRCLSQITSGSVRNPRSYLYRSAANAANNGRRATSRERQRQLQAVAPAPPPHDEPNLGHVRDAICQLSTRQRAVLYLAYWEDQTEVAIAETLGVHVGTVRRHLQRAHQSLRRSLT
jgi:RNA polymerase sigma factor (sigma-70 family)